MTSRASVHQKPFFLLPGDLTHPQTLALAPAAIFWVGGGGGVDGAIHRAAGPQLLAETRQLGGCETGDAKITQGYNLKARHVIHTVGPVYRANDPDVPLQLASAHRRSLEVAVENGLKTLAFPAISTGVFGYPVNEAAQISLKTTFEFARHNDQLQLVRFVLFDGRTLAAFQVVLNDLANRQSESREMP